MRASPARRLNKLDWLHAGMAWCQRGIMLILLVPLFACGLPQVRESDKPPSMALRVEEVADTQLGQTMRPLKAAHPGESGIMPLLDAYSAFAARMLLTHSAQKTLDVQYYIWRNDNTGILFLEALRKAAERGVRVRLLLDDNGISGREMDARLAALNKHPNIEVRLFNPFPFRTFKPLGFLTDFSRLNRRMHNKSFTADNMVTIIGGRNVGDEYFGATDGILFADLDVMAIGAVVDDTSQDFDRYWASASAYPLSVLIPAPSDEELQALSAAADKAEKTVTGQGYLKALKESQFIHDFIKGQHAFDWSKVELISDSPDKITGEAKKDELMVFNLARILRNPKESVDLVSPYFVPTQTGVDGFSALARKGINIRILTNALESTDVAAVHAGYAKWRKPLLQAGIRLYEMRSQVAGSGMAKYLGALGSSGSSLHAKTFTIDRSRVFIGSFNFDPRSAQLNTELGFMIESPGLAQQMEQAFKADVPESAYEVRLDENNRLYWLSYQDGVEQRYSVDPGTTLMQRFFVRILSIMPIDWLL
ncbi:phospholipase D family protein [Methylobacillus flagellatus]|uniref:phospholipase D family protein n=1 Tax=Methylobacillus flagellatus TaxID=405 RepID=UPI002853F8F1|nr:phospholipase D family protein [Methylobacillus flagellatus]MDR5170686.1 phospholipase D family protein [Methylobacillus flagellatus]